jgi:hypothetical protein
MMILAETKSVSQSVSQGAALLVVALFITHLLSTGRGHTYFNTSISIFSQFTSKVFVQFGVEDTVGNLQ